MDILDIRQLDRHSLHFIEMAFTTDRCRCTLHAHAHAVGRHTGRCGDSVAFYLTFCDDLLCLATFEIEGCWHTHACANTVARLAEGRCLERAWEITPDQVSDYLETLPHNHQHCAELAVGAFYLALADYQERRRRAAAATARPLRGAHGSAK